jgi:hypothetical protein
MEKIFLWKTSLFFLSCFGFIFFIVIFGLYAKNSLTGLNKEDCFLQNCNIYNSTCKQICPEHQPLCVPANFTCQYKYGNYSFRYNKETYYALLDYSLYEDCIDYLSCKFQNPNETIYFSPVNSVNIGFSIFIIFSIALFGTFPILLIFHHCWKIYYKIDIRVETSEEDGTGLLLKSDNINPNADKYEEIK